MKLNIENKKSAFLLVEAFFAVVLVSIVAYALLAGIAYGMVSMRLNRHTQIATQVLVDKSELVRYRGWNALPLLPHTFEEVRAGVPFTGRIEASPVNLGANYSRKMRAVQITIWWKTGSLERTRTWTTFVAEQGWGSGYDLEYPGPWY